MKYKYPLLIDLKGMAFMDKLKVNKGNALSKIDSIIAENKRLASELESFKAKLSGGLVDELITKAEKIGDISFISASVKDMDMNALRNMGDQIKEKTDNAVIFLASENEGKVSLVVMCTDSAVKSGANAGKLIKEAAVICGGGGGGKPNTAQAGAKDATKIPDAIAKVKELLNTL